MVSALGVVIRLLHGCLLALRLVGCYSLHNVEVKSFTFRKGFGVSILLKTSMQTAVPKGCMQLHGIHIDSKRFPSSQMETCYAVSSSAETLFYKVFGAKACLGAGLLLLGAQRYVKQQPAR